jgi:hypothetical protein
MKPRLDTRSTKPLVVLDATQTRPAVARKVRARRAAVSCRTSTSRRARGLPPYRRDPSAFPSANDVSVDAYVAAICSGTTKVPSFRTTNRPIAPASLNQITPRFPLVMSIGKPSAFGSENDVTVPVTEILTMAFAAPCVSQRLPSRPRQIPPGGQPLSTDTGNSVMTPSGVIRPTLERTASRSSEGGCAAHVNQRLPSGPTVISPAGRIAGQRRQEELAQLT